jgi:hypothetical protein
MVTVVLGRAMKDLVRFEARRVVMSKRELRLMKS